MQSVKLREDTVKPPVKQIILRGSGLNNKNQQSYIYIYIYNISGSKTQNAKCKFWNVNLFFLTGIQNVVAHVDQMKKSAPERAQNVISKRESD